MNENNAQNKSVDRKQKIREKYKGIDPSRLIVIPAKPEDEVALDKRKLKVAAYVRVSTENDEQTSSYELQVNDFTDRINANPNWEFAGIYSDEGISGTELSHRKGMLQMIEDAKAGKIEHILAKSIARFARNVVDCLSIIEELRGYGVGVYFDESNLYTLDGTGALVLTILATVAEEESRSKSFIMNWSIERRFAKGIFLIQELLGYDKDEDGNLVINREEAETVKVIFCLFLNGWSLSKIAKKLSYYERRTKRGNTNWQAATLRGVLENERHCGDILAHKTYTPNFKTHKSVKNVNQRTKYIDQDNHEAIVSRDVYQAANRMLASMKFVKGNRSLPVLSVVEEGILEGFVPIHKDWTGFSGEEYAAASGSVGNESRHTQRKGKWLDLRGYQRVRASFFPSYDNLALTLENGKMRFSTSCAKKFVDVEYVELLLNPKKNCIAVRPCGEDAPNAIRWARLKDQKWLISPVSCKGLAHALMDIMEWDSSSRYRLYGQYIENEEGKLLMFSLDEPDIIRTETQIIVQEAVGKEVDDAGDVDSIGGQTVVKDNSSDGTPLEMKSNVDKKNGVNEHSTSSDRLSHIQRNMLVNNAMNIPSGGTDISNRKGIGDAVEGMESIVITEKVRVYPSTWRGTFGTPITSVVWEYLPAPAKWKILSPAKEISGKNPITADILNELMNEANTIMRGWAKNESEYA